MDQRHRLRDYVEVIAAESLTASIPEERKVILDQLAEYVARKIQKDEEIKLMWVCTHNSRRSQLSQIWCQVLALHYDIPKLSSFSAGTEVTSFHPNTLEPLRDSGIRINSTSGESANPKYEIIFDLGKSGQGSLICFSKLIKDESNPRDKFAAIMTCTSADHGCPIVSGAEKRIALPFTDPKSADGTPDQAQAYARTSRQIAQELAYAFEKAKQMTSRA